MTKQTHLRALMLAGALILPVSAIAGTLAVDPSLATCDAPGAGLIQGTQSGRLYEFGSGIPSGYTGFGEKIPFGIALSMVIPKHYVVYGASGVNLKTPVSWHVSKKKPWTSVARNILRQAGLYGVLQWQTGRILLSQHNPVPTPSGYSPVSAPSNPAIAKQMVSKNRVWTIPRGADLQTAVQTWANESDWRVIWHSQLKTNVPNNTTIKGTFKQAIHKLVRYINDDLADMNAKDWKLKAKFYTNNTVIVSDQFTETDVHP